MAILTAITFITLALVFYSIGVWAEHIQNILKPWHLLCFWIGLVCDTTGTYLMGLIADESDESEGLSFHLITGLLAIILMLIHALWASFILIRKDASRAARFHRFSVIVWVIWLIPYLSGMIMNM